MKRKILCVLLLLILGVWQAAGVFAQELENIVVSGATRNMMVYAPDGLGENPPLVISLHGANQDAAYQRNQTHWNECADTAKFVVVYPNAINKFWDVNGTSDIRFIEAVIEKMGQRYDVDRNRIYITGFSLGGMMTYHCMEHLGDKVAAFGPVSGVRFDAKAPKAPRKVPFIHTHGTGDDVFKWGGDPGHAAGGYPYIPDYVEKWAKYEDLDIKTEVKPYPSSNKRSIASLTTWHSANDTIEVALLALEGKGHWHSEDLASGVSTTQEIWRFFRRYTLTAPTKEFEARIQVNDRQKFQHVSGFGGFSPSPTWQYWLGDLEMNKLFGTANNQLGLNILRLYIANNRSGWSAGVDNAKAAKRHGAFIFASPWSPPAEWKSNGSDSNGGELLEEHYADWANYLNDYYRYMKEQGVEIDAVSIQNEPDWNTSYQSCIWTGEKLAKFLRGYGHLIECKIIAPEAVHFSKNMHEPILNDPEACEELDILGGHFYGWDGTSYPLAAQKGKEVWMTEYLINSRQNDEGKDINWRDDGFSFAKSVNDAMLANMSAWVHYSLKRYYGCLGDGSFGTQNNRITKRGYILSHYAKYVSGTTRIKHTLDDETRRLSSSAFIDPDGEKIVVMLINPSANAYNMEVELPFYTLGFKQIATTETVNMSKKDLACDEETYTPSVYVKPWSVSTYIFEKSSGRGDSGYDDPKDQLVFSDNFEEEGSACIPAGWKSKSEEGIRMPGKYALGPRIMTFSNEGSMNYGFYFRTDAAAPGYISYGELADSPLALDKGDYILTFSTIGWKALPQVKASVVRGDIVIASVDATPTAFVSASGPDTRITETTDHILKFEVMEQDHYKLVWEIEKSKGGFAEALLGNVRLYRQNAAGIDDVLMDNPLEFDDVIYDIYGRKISNPCAPGIYIQNGKKFLVR